MIRGPNIPGSYAILLFTASDFTSITSHIHNWVLFLLSLHFFILLASQVAQMVKCLPAMEETRVRFLGQGFPGERNDNPLQYSCLENSMDGGAWQATVHGIAKSRTRLSDFTSFSLELFLHSSSVAYWAPTDLGSSSFTVLFILFIGFSRQEYWSGLPFPSPVDLVLSELSIRTCPSWVALYSMTHSFIELDKAVVHVIRSVHFLY